MIEDEWRLCKCQCHLHKGMCSIKGCCGDAYKLYPRNNMKNVAGVVTSYIHHNNRIGVLLELSCETDFVARTIEFKELARDMARQVAAIPCNTVAELMEQDHIVYGEKVADVFTNAVKTFKEKIAIERFVRFELGEFNND